MTIVEALKKLFSLSNDPKTIAEALDEAEISGGSDLPEVTASDNGKFLKVIEGAWGKGSGDGLPAVTGSDNGKGLVVSEGAWATAAGAVFCSATGSTSIILEIPVIAWDSDSGTWKKFTCTVLPKTGNSIKGKVPVGSSGGYWQLVDAAMLPAVTATDNGKILKVVDGAWAVAASS